MISIYPAATRYSTDHGWLQSNFSFSFADYYDPANMEFGPLRVFNDDTIQEGRGFGAHPHREMEIVSVVLKGYLKHEDSTGNMAETTWGQVQRMSAGTGIIHSEVNGGKGEVQLLQLWFTPEQNGLQPSYETTDFQPEEMKNRLLPIVSKQSGPGIAHIYQDMTIYLSDLEAGQSITYSQPEGRRIYVFVMEGSLKLNGEEHLNRRDAARIQNESKLDMQSGAGTRFMLIDLP